MNLSELDKKDLKSELLSLMENVSSLLKEQPDVDKFLDETDLFDDWERILPQAEYPIFIIAVLNNIRKILSLTHSLVQLRTRMRSGILT